jgi:hypothetical protein
MPETRQVTFTYQELAEILVKQQDIHEGLWGVYFELGIGGGNVSTPDGNFVPAAVVPMQRVGIQKVDEEIQGLTVDAAVVNPAPKSAS